MWATKMTSACAVDTVNTIRATETAAGVGASGCGKETTIKEADMDHYPAVVGQLPYGYSVERVELFGGRFVSWALMLNGQVLSTHHSAEKARAAAFNEHV